MSIVVFDYFLAELKKGEIMDETYFYFTDEEGIPEHYTGCLSEYERPYWAGLCDIPNGTDFETAEELVNAKICHGKPLKERWNEVRVICMGGIPVPDYISSVSQ